MDCNWFNFPQAAKDAIQLEIEREEHAKEQARLEQMKEEKALLQREEEERKKVSEIRISAKLVFICSGGSRISPRRGRQLLRGAPTYDFAKFSQKLHEIERISAPGGGVPRALPLRSATDLCYSLCQFKTSEGKIYDIIFEKLLL